jgi:hypothetical protein
VSTAPRQATEKKKLCFSMNGLVVAEPRLDLEQTLLEFLFPSYLDKLSTVMDL